MLLKLLMLQNKRESIFIYLCDNLLKIKSTDDHQYYYFLNKPLKIKLASSKLIR